jgi:hypothetical protein
MLLHPVAVVNVHGKGVAGKKNGEKMESKLEL